MVLLEAERRWNGVEAASWHPLAAMVAHGMARPAVPVLPQQVIARLAGRGITLLLGEDGTIRATPAGMLNETDRAQITEHKAEIVKALASAEVVA